MSDTNDKSTTEEVILDEKATETIVGAVADKMKSEMGSIAEESASKAVEAYISKTEEANKKKIADQADKDAANKGGSNQSSDYADMPKEVRMVRGVQALLRNDGGALAKINKVNMELRAKAGYANTGTNADGGYLVPDPDFDAEVERLEETYGVAIRFADVRQINSNSVKLNKKSGSGVTMYETDEAEAKTGTKLSIDQVTADLRKFAAIAPVTDELSEDAAIDFWAELTRDFAREDARIDDVLVFTDATSGIIEQNSGIATVGTGTASIADVTLDDLADATVKVPTPSSQNGAFFMHRTVWNVLRKEKASTTGEYQLLPGPNGTIIPTVWGYPVVFTEVLPSTAQDGDNKGFIVFGDLRNVKLYKKRGLDLTVLTEGTVKDADGNDFNLALQDGKALRAVARKLAVIKFKEAFCVIGTGTVS